MLTKKDLLYFSLKNQYLLNKAEKATVMSDLCGLQAQFANNPKYGLLIRASDYDETNWGEGLVKTWTLRNTMHVVRKDELGLYLSAKGVPVEWSDRWNLKKEIKPYWSAFIYEQIKQGVVERQALKEACRKQGMSEDILQKVFHGWGGLFKEMSRRGLIAYEVGTKKRFVACESVSFIEQETAQAQLIKRYFRVYGPAKLEDCAAFTGFRQRDIRRLIKDYDLGLRSVRCEGSNYYHIKDLTGDGKIPPCLYLTGFDQLIMGYKDRSRFMDDEDKRKVITLTGIVFPTILLNGKLRARWKKDKRNLIIMPFARLADIELKRIEAKGRELFGKEITNVVFS